MTTSNKLVLGAAALWLAIAVFSWSQQPYWPDAGGYAEHLAEGRFVAHPPGYLFFVLLGHGIHSVVATPYLATQLASFLLCLASFPMLLLLFSRAGAVAESMTYLLLAYGFSWILLITARTGTSHTADLLSCAFLLWAAIPIIKAETKARDWFLLGLAMVLVAGFRLTSFITQIPLLATLLLLNLWHPRLWATYAVSGLLIVGLQFLIIQLSGGWEPYSSYAAAMASGNRQASILLSGINTPTLLNSFRSLLWFAMSLGPMLLFIAFLKPSLLRDRIFWVGMVSAAGVLALTTLYLCTHPGYLLGALPGTFLAASRVWSAQSNLASRKKLRHLCLGAAAFGCTLFLALTPIIPPKTPPIAILNGVLLQYGFHGSRHSIFHTTSEWLLIYGFGGNVPAERIEEIQRQGRDQPRP
jgi:hypothetical protein